MTVSIIVVTYNSREFIGECLNSLYAEPMARELEVIVVDNDSHDGTADFIRGSFPHTTLIESGENLGFAAGNNLAFKRASGDYLLLLNPDTQLVTGAIGKLVDFMKQNPSCGICGGRLNNGAGELLPSARRFPNVLYKLFMISGLADRFPDSRIFGAYGYSYLDHEQPIEAQWVPGTFAIYRRDMLEQIDAFDERFFLYYEETDLCLRAKQAGWQIFYNPQAAIMHLEGACSKTRNDLDFETTGAQIAMFRIRSETLFFRKNRGIFSTLANMGLEIVWHMLRWVLNLIPWRQHAAEKRHESRQLIRQIFEALRDTRWGTFSPPRPW